MERELRVTERFDAPVEHVGGALERFVSQSDVWSSSSVDREGGTLELMLRAGWAPWVDQVAIELETGAPGTTELRLVLKRPLLLSRAAPRRRHLDALLAGVRELIGG